MLEMPTQDFLTPMEIARRYGVGRSTVDSWYADGLSFEWRDGRHGRTKVQRGDVVEAWLKKTGRLGRISMALKKKESARSVPTSGMVAVFGGGNEGRGGGEGGVGTGGTPVPRGSEGREGGLFADRERMAPGPPRIDDIQNLFRVILSRCEQLEQSTVNVSELNQLTASMKRLSDGARLLEEHAVTAQRERGEWIEAARARNAVTNLAALFATDLDAMSADVVSAGAVELDPFVVAGKLDDVRRVLAVVLRGGVDRLRERIAAAVEARGAELGEKPAGGGS